MHGAVLTESDFKEQLVEKKKREQAKLEKQQAKAEKTETKSRKQPAKKKRLLLPERAIKKTLKKVLHHLECEEPDDEEEKGAIPLDEELIGVYTMLCSGIAH